MLLACLGLFLAVGLVLGPAFYRLWMVTGALRADIAALQALANGGVEALDAESAVSALHATHTDLLALQVAARPFLWMCPYLGWVPRYGPVIEAAPALLEASLDLTAASSELIEALNPLTEKIANEGAPANARLAEEAVETLADVRPQLLATQDAIEKARAVREELPVEGLDPQIQGYIEQFDRYLPLLDQAVKAAQLLPGLLGIDGTRTYLVLVQNEDELRATGGLISGAARVTVKSGRLLDVQVEDSYAIDDFSHPYPEPPVPLQEIMLAELWVFRDSNWSPDFPTSARAALDLYGISRDARVDDVVATDQQAIRLLVDAVGPLEVEGLAGPVTGDTVIELARQAWEPGDEAAPDWFQHRKDFMTTLLDSVLRRLEGRVDQEALLRLARATLQALRQKHLLLYVTDEEAASLVADLGWDGALAQRPGDYLMVVDANVGFNKANALIEERLSYSVDLSDVARPRALLTVVHHHTAKRGESPCNQQARYDKTYVEMMQRCYWDYLRIYTPLGTQLVDATPHAISASELLSGKPHPAEVTEGPPELGHEVFATLLLLRPQETLETRFEMLLPATVLRAESRGFTYRLTIQKQPGTRAYPLQVRVQLPTGMKQVRSAPPPTSTAGTELRYELTLETDQTLTLVFR